MDSMAARRTNWRNLIMVISLGILIAVELFGVALASGWALAGLFELGAIVSYVLMALFSVLAGYAMVNLMRRVLKVERLSEGG
jgi:predicted membrane channel-forming protein YqfA (hemolysin III family)